jgi:hypothetical protein
MNYKLLLLLTIILSSLVLFGCTSSGVSIPYTTSQLIAQSTDLNYSSFLAGDYNGLCLQIDNNVLTAGACGDVNVGTDWSDITGFPVGCSAGQAVQVVGTTLTCIDLPIDTNFETAGYDFGDYIPYTGADKDVNIGDNNFELDGSVIIGKDVYGNELPISHFEDLSGTHWGDRDLSGLLIGDAVTNGIKFPDNDEWSAGFIFDKRYGINVQQGVIPSTFINVKRDDYSGLAFEVVGVWAETTASGRQAKIANIGVLGNFGDADTDPYLDMLSFSAHPTEANWYHIPSFAIGRYATYVNPDKVYITPDVKDDTITGLQIVDGDVSVWDGSIYATDGSIYATGTSKAIILREGNSERIKMSHSNNNGGNLQLFDETGTLQAIIRGYDISGTQMYLKQGNLQMLGDNLAVTFGAGDDASIKYDGTNLIINPKEVGSGLVYVDGNVSATGFITRTSVYDKSKGSALEQIKDSSLLVDSKGKIKHEDFYGYTPILVTDFSKPVSNFIDKNICVDEPIVIEQETNYTPICKIVKEEIIEYPFKKVEGGVNIVDEIELLRQAIVELKNIISSMQTSLINTINRVTGAETEINILKGENTLIKNELCKKDSSYVWCKVVK